jgi:hypothetical protein
MGFNFNRKKFSYGSNSVLARDVPRGSAALDFPSVAAAGVATLTITVKGAAVGDDVVLSHRVVPTAGLRYSAWVSAADTVTVQVNNLTAGAVDAVSATIGVIVFKAY